MTAFISNKISFSKWNKIKNIRFGDSCIELQQDEQEVKKLTDDVLNEKIKRVISTKSSPKNKKNLKFFYKIRLIFYFTFSMSLSITYRKYSYRISSYSVISFVLLYRYHMIHLLRNRFDFVNNKCL